MRSVVQEVVQKKDQPRSTSTSVARSNTAAPAGPQHGADLILQLQRQIGNQAVQRMLSQARPGSPAGVQTKLTVNTPGDVFEQEADRVSDQVMRTPEPQVQRACACGGRCPKCQAGQPHHEHEGMQIQRAGSDSLGQTEAPPLVHEVLRSSGQPLEPGTRDFMESRFGYDFSRVKVHTDSRAAASSQAIQARAYTAGDNVVFGSGQYAPHTESGQRLLAHELTHVVQQGGGQGSRISRFADTDHNVLEEAALTLSNMPPEEIEQVHAGNTKRDYSQSPAMLNLVLLCDLDNYGDYKAEDHFDNYRWDEALHDFRRRDAKSGPGMKSPIHHIEVELINFVDALPAKEAFQHVGSAFHAIEDFFAHSNFIELSHGDFQFGRELITGSVDGPDDVSLLKILESTSSLETAPFFGGRANQHIAQAPDQSHPRMAKDYKSNPYYMEANVLAGLVIKEMGMEILALKALETKEKRVQYVREVIMPKVKRYLRPPSESDKWWETLREAGGHEMESSIRRLAARTPVTTNQCILSPMRSIEASRDSNFKLLGPAFTIPTSYGHVWVQVGTGFSAPPAFAGPSGAVEPRSLDFLPLGVQVTGRFGRK